MDCPLRLDNQTFFTNSAGIRPLSALKPRLGALPYTAREIVLDGALIPLASAWGLSPDQALNPETRLESLPDSERPLHDGGIKSRASRDARAAEDPLLLSFGLPSVRDEIEKDYDNNQNETC